MNPAVDNNTAESKTSGDVCRRLVGPRDRITIPAELITSDDMAALRELADALNEEDMLKSMLSAVNGINRETYEIIKEDYRIAFMATRKIKSRISEFVMQHYYSENNTLSWSFSGDTWTIEVYAHE